MLNELRKKLVLIFTVSTGTILTAVLVLVLLVSGRQFIQNKKEAFTNNFMTVTQNVLTKNEVSNLWLAEIELKNRLLIHIEDNDQTLFYKGSWKTATDRRTLIGKLKNLAMNDKIDTDKPLVSVNEIQSKIYEFKGDSNDRYIGQIYIHKTGEGLRSILVIQYISRNFIVTLRQVVIIILLYISGIFGLYFVSRWVVGKSLKPVEDSRRRQTEFVASASHELKSPLAVIRANASALVIEPERAEQFTKGIDMECARMSSLIEDMLLLASADSQNWSIIKEPIDMDLLMIEIYDIFLPLYIKRLMNLKLELQEEMLPQIHGDELRVRQIISIMLDNAASYSSAGDTVVLRACSVKGLLSVEVEDHGVGIEPGMKDEIFERFFKGDKSRRDKSHFGLGLSIARELAELHSGNITFRDTPGGGATFIASFPTK